MIYYGVKSVKKYIHPMFGFPDYVVHATVLIKEAETIPKNSIISIGEYTTSINWFELEELACAFADLVDPAHPHKQHKGCMA
jgi:hypothetical protein